MSGQLNDLAGRTVMVVGASRGIGAQVARDAAARGATVVAVARTEAGLADLQTQIRADGDIAHVLPADASDADSIAACVENARSGIGDIDALVYAAGAAVVGNFEDFDDAVWTDLFTLNVLGAVRFSRELLPQMRKNSSGRIVMIASTAAKYGSMMQSPYNTSKHALLGLVRCLALETASQGITVNAVCPGFVDTDMVRKDLVPARAQLTGLSEEQVLQGVVGRVPTGQMLTVEEVSALTVHLLTDAARNVTGQGLTIDGGMILV